MIITLKAHQGLEFGILRNDLIIKVQAQRHKGNNLILLVVIGKN